MPSLHTDRGGYTTPPTPVQKEYDPNIALKVLKIKLIYTLQKECTSRMNIYKFYWGYQILGICSWEVYLYKLQVPMLQYLFTTGPIPVVNLVISFVCLSMWTQIFATTSRNLLLDMMMPDIFLYGLVSQTHRQKSVSEKHSNVKRYTAGCSA